MCDDIDVVFFKPPATRAPKGIFCIYTDLQHGKSLQNSPGHEGMMILFWFVKCHRRLKIQMETVSFYLKGLSMECLNLVPNKQSPDE